MIFSGAFETNTSYRRPDNQLRRRSRSGIWI